MNWTPWFLDGLLVDLVELLSLRVPEEDHDLVEAEQLFEEALHSLIDTNEIPQRHDLADYENQIRSDYNEIVL